MRSMRHLTLTPQEFLERAARADAVSPGQGLDRGRAAVRRTRARLVRWAAAPVYP